MVDPSLQIKHVKQFLNDGSKSALVVSAFEKKDRKRDWERVSHSACISLHYIVHYYCVFFSSL